MRHEILLHHVAFNCKFLHSAMAYPHCSLGCMEQEGAFLLCFTLAAAVDVACSVVAELARGRLLCLQRAQDMHTHELAP